MMSNQRRGFDYIWDGIIRKVIIFCSNDINQDFRDQAEVKVFDLSRYKNKLREAYHKKRDWLKLEYLPHKYNPSLDFHKLSAILCRCVIGFKPISYNEKVANLLFNVNQNKKISSTKKLEWQIVNVYVNYRIAFLIAAGVAYDDLLCWIQIKINKLEETLKLAANLEKEKNQERLKIFKLFKEKLIEKSTLITYQKSATHDDFETSMIVSLMKNDNLKRDFDYLSFATNMFQWQEYTKYVFFTEILSCGIEKYSYHSVKDILDLCKN